MAISSLQNESAPAKPLSLHAVGMELEDAQASAEELARLIWIVSGNAELIDEPVRQALRAIMTLAEKQGADLADLAERVFDASKAERGENVAEFPAR